MKYTLRKYERLHSKKEIDELFQHSNSLFVYPFKILYATHNDSAIGNASILFTMSHKKFKHAVQRNAVKRHLKESYRLHKLPLIQLLVNKKLNAKIAFIYIADNLITHQEMETKMKLTIKRLCKIIEQENPNNIVIS
ncbi:MAG: ribonuclease P protein component [Bacteroidales bacterium]|nr:ribonuclease P protein component [Bacteroidales bacterium]